MNSQPLPICLVVGFLGSGKTSFLQATARRYQDRNLLFLVNEFSATDIDGQRLQGIRHPVMSIPGGSIFCHCLITEFLDCLRGVAENQHQGKTHYSGVVIEASGMANPGTADQLLRESRLDNGFRLASIVAIVDPGSFLKLRRTLPVISDQIGAADVVLLNKGDLCPAEQVETAVAELRQLRSGIPIIHTQHGVADVNLFPTRDLRTPVTGVYDGCRDPHFAAFHLPLPHGASLDALRECVEAVEPSLFRIKGTLRVGDRWWEIDGAGGNLDYKEAPEGGHQSELVLVMAAENAVAVRARFKSLRHP